jgi:hypothetical protein
MKTIYEKILNSIRWTVAGLAFLITALPALTSFTTSY